MGEGNRRYKEHKRFWNLPIAKPFWISNTKQVHKQPKQKQQQKSRDNNECKPQIGVTLLTLIFQNSFFSPLMIDSWFSLFVILFPLSFRVTEKVRNWDLIDCSGCGSMKENLWRENERQILAMIWFRIRRSRWIQYW